MDAAVPDLIYDFFGKDEILTIADIHPEIAFRMILEESVDDLQNNFFRVSDSSVFNEDWIAKITVRQMIEIGIISAVFCFLLIIVSDIHDAALLI